LAAHILVLDDEPTIRELVAEAVRDAGHLVETASNGRDALRKMREQPPDAIILDLMMPVMDAVSFRSAMRTEAAFQNIPILVMTAAYAPEAMVKSLGADAWVVKPFELDDLLAALDTLLIEPRPQVEPVS
jgi:DNA-binding response OmpR family regulator